MLSCRYLQFIIFLAAPRNGKFFAQTLNFTIIVDSEVPPILYPVQKSVLLIQMDVAVARSQTPKIWLTSLTNKVAIVIDLRAQSTRRFRFQLYQCPLTDWHISS